MYPLNGKIVSPLLHSLGYHCTRPHFQFFFVCTMNSTRSSLTSVHLVLHVFWFVHWPGYLGVSRLRMIAAEDGTNLCILIQVADTVDTGLHCMRVMTLSHCTSVCLVTCMRSQFIYTVLTTSVNTACFLL